MLSTLLKADVQLKADLASLVMPNLLSTLLKADVQLKADLASPVTGQGSVWWQGISIDDKISLIQSAKLSPAQWSQASAVQRGILVNEFKKLEEQRAELRALQDPKFRAELARLRGLSYHLERDAVRRMGVNQSTKSVLIGKIHDQQAADPLVRSSAI